MLDEIKMAALSLVVFVAWVIASQGWVLLVAIVWLVYPGDPPHGEASTRGLTRRGVTYETWPSP